MLHGFSLDDVGNDYTSLLAMHVHDFVTKEPWTPWNLKFMVFLSLLSISKYVIQFFKHLRPGWFCWIRSAGEITITILQVSNPLNFADLYAENI